MGSSRSRRVVGVLTLHRCINYGSYWQARCLVEALTARGVEPVVLDHESRRVNVAEWRCALRPTLPTPVPRSDVPRYREKVRQFGRAIAELPLSPRFGLADADIPGSYDAVVVGSDEVWNLHHPWYGGYPLFFGQGVRAERLVSYAASFGSHDPSEALDPSWADRLQRFDSISVRDESSSAIISDALGHEPDLVIDPCLLVPPRPAGEWRGPQQPFVAVYGHNFAPRFTTEVRRHAAERGLRLVSIGYRNDWADEQWISASPDDFAHCFARAQAVATNFFHGCVFALRHVRPFVCEPQPYREQKVRSLMASVGGDSHLVSCNTGASVFDERLSEPPSDDVLRRVNDLCHHSDAFLDAALA